MSTLTVNGKIVTVNAEADTPLLWVLRGGGGPGGLIGGMMGGLFGRR
jgi:aerobic-type carbon monoxide dehydrogenase small subunit (CoxS/CutS family)